MAPKDLDTSAAEDGFTLELIHIADQEGNTESIDDAPRLSAVLNALRSEDLGGDGLPDNTLTLSSGDAYIPGLFFGASEAVFGAGGIGDIQIQNELGIEAIAFGNHEFDFDTRVVQELFTGLDVTDDSEDDFVDTVPLSIGNFDALFGSTLEGLAFGGTIMPYLATNLDFSSDQNLAALEVPGGQAPKPQSVTSSTVIDVNGVPVGVVGAVTPTLPSISSPGDLGVAPLWAGTNPSPDELDALAEIIQAEVDTLLAADTALNKVVLLAHMQQISIELALAERLENVDIIVAGGSDTILVDENDRLRDGDAAQEPFDYPQEVENAGGTTTLVVNTDGQYRYVGRLVIEFDADGNVVPESYDPDVSGAFATDDQGVIDLGAEDLIDPEIQAIVDALRAQIELTEGNVFGVSEVFLNGNRAGDEPDGVRTQQTNLGDLTADANLAEAQKSDAAVVLSLKNGGGIRASIGQTVVPPGGSEPERLPNEEIRDESGDVLKPEGGISQNDIETTLAFNNGLTLLTLTGSEIVDLLEHGVSALPGVAGQFPQIAGVKFSYDPDLPPGDRIQSAGIFDDDDALIAELVRNGELVNPDATHRMVTLSFLAGPRFDDEGNFTGGGDGYPFPNTNTDPASGEVGDPDVIARIDLVDLETEGVADGDATFADNGTEQDALAEYLDDNFNPFGGEGEAFTVADMPQGEDARIQNLEFREDTVFGDAPGGGLGLPADPAPEAENVLEASVLSTTEVPGSEIVDYAEDSGLAFVTSGDGVQVVDISDPTMPILGDSITFESLGLPNSVTSVSVFGDLVAAAVPADPETDNGSVVFFSTDGTLLGAVTVGALPDMLTFSPDGAKVLVANEGEADGDIDPAGSVSIITVNAADPSASIVETLDFSALSGQEGALLAKGVRIFPDKDAALDLEPEYIAVSGTTAFVALQEANAYARIADINNPQPFTIEDVFTAGAVDHSVPGGGIDASDRDDGINILTYPVTGLPMPDGIAAFELDGQGYFVSANEGDARDEDVRAEDLDIDPANTALAAAAADETVLGRLEVSSIDGDADGDGVYEELFSYGGRSFSIYDTDGNLVFDSGDLLERITAAEVPELFNSSDGDPEEFDSRSDNKGPEPEAVTVGEIGGVPYLFVALERTGGVAVFDISDPTAPVYEQYLFVEGDVAPEGLKFIPAADSPTGAPILAVANEVSETLSLIELAPRLTSIGTIQGASQVSPLVLEAAGANSVAAFFAEVRENDVFSVDGPEVTARGVVTAVDTNGFYLQDPEGDGDDATSDALFVFTRDAPALAVGDLAEVTGTASEFFPGSSDTGNLPTTQISDVSAVSVLASDVALPEAVTLGADGRIPPTENIEDDAFIAFNPEDAGIDFFESLEGMRVTVSDAVAVAGTNRFGEIFTVADGGDGATGLSERGTLNISPDDFNPERIQIDADSGVLPEFEMPMVDVGARLGDVTGVVGYGFGNFEVIPTEVFAAEPSALTPEISETTGGTGYVTVASYNVLNLDPNDDDGDTDVADFRFGSIAAQIVNNLNAPDIIALQEIQDNSGSVDDGTVAADETLTLLSRWIDFVDDFQINGSLEYGWIDNTFIEDNASGGQPGGNIRTAYLYNTETVSVVEGSVATISGQGEGEAFEGARLPLVASFAAEGSEITLVNTHFSSKGGSAPILGTSQPFDARQEEPAVNGSLDERQVQSSAVAVFVADLLAEDPDAALAVLGDFNEFEFVSPVIGLEAAGLSNLTSTLADEERYSFIFQGNSQSLDHILASPALLEGAEFDAVHVNAEFAASETRASDHDPLLAKLGLGADSGTATAASEADSFMF